MPQNKEELLRELIDKYAKIYMKMAYNRGVPYDDVEDIVMDAFMSFYDSESFDKVRGDEKGTKLVLARIVANKCNDYYRKNARAEIIGMSECEGELEKVSRQSGTDPFKAVAGKESYQRICECINGMKEIWR